VNDVGLRAVTMPTMCNMLTQLILHHSHLQGRGSRMEDIREPTGLVCGDEGRPCEDSVRSEGVRRRCACSTQRGEQAGTSRSSGSHTRPFPPGTDPQKAFLECTKKAEELFDYWVEHNNQVRHVLSSCHKLFC
jgi:hypothetical protein